MALFWITARRLGLIEVGLRLVDFVDLYEKIDFLDTKLLEIE
jgi:hypothetical protein